MGKIMINGEQYPSYIVETGIDDSQIRNDKAWSSEKVNTELEDVRNELDVIVTEVNKNTTISDDVTSLTTTWSSQKTSGEIDKITYSTDANECIPALMKTARYNLINTSANVPNSNYSWVLTAEHIKLSTGQYYRIIQDINGTKSDGGTIKYTRAATSADDVTWTWNDWVVDGLISDTTSSTTSTYSSAKIDTKLEKKLFAWSNSPSVLLGFEAKGTYTIEEFMKALYAVSQSGSVTLWFSNSTSIDVKHNDTTVTLNGGSLIWNGTDINKAWQAMSVTYIPATGNNIYKIRYATDGDVKPFNQGIEVYGDISDSSTSETSTWSSSKIKSYIDTIRPTEYTFVDVGESVDTGWSIKNVTNGDMCRILIVNVYSSGKSGTCIYSITANYGDSTDLNSKLISNTITGNLSILVSSNGTIVIKNAGTGDNKLWFKLITP